MLRQKHLVKSLLLLLTKGAAVGCAVTLLGLSSAAAQQPLPAVTTAKPVVREIVESDSFIGRFEAVGDYTAAHAGGEPHLLHLSLNQLEERLDPQRFMRIHRAHLVNLDHVVAFRRDAAGQVRAELRDRSAVPVSRAKARELRGLVK